MTIQKYNQIEYLFEKRSNKLFLIKVGAGGDVFGYQNKYITIMNNYLKHDYSVLICNNPPDINDKDNFDFSIQLANILMSDYEVFEITYFGHSKGAYQGAIFGHSIVNISNMILINAPLIINYDKQIKGLNKFNGNKVYVYYGMNDFSYRYFELFRKVNNSKIKVEALENIDHDFSENLDLFIELANKAL